jgi:hypothetical protein
MGVGSFFVLIVFASGSDNDKAPPCFAGMETFDNQSNVGSQIFQQNNKTTDGKEAASRSFACFLYIRGAGRDRRSRTL